MFYAFSIAPFLKRKFAFFVKYIAFIFNNVIIKVRNSVMDIKNFIFSYFNNATEGLHIKKVKHSTEAQAPHTHEYFQIFYVIKGHLTHYVEDVSSTLYRGNMTIIPPNVQHHVGSIDDDTAFYSFSFMNNIFDKSNNSDRIAVNFLNQLIATSKTSIQPKITLPDDEILYIETIIDRMYKEFNSKTVGSDEIIRSNAVILLTVFARTYFETVKEALPSGVKNLNQYVLYCIQYIDSNFQEPLSLTEMAKRSAMSKSSFCNVFNTLTGYSFKQYLNLKRIEHAVKLIKKGYQLTAIYGLCGYEDYSTFIRNFKKIMGVSPSQYQTNN